MNCKLIDANGGCRCSACGRFYRGLHASDTLAQCGVEEKKIVEHKPATQGLGDKAEAILKAAGITPERYAEAKALFGLPPTCNCSKRKEWLNKIGEWWEHAKGKQ